MKTRLTAALVAAALAAGCTTTQTSNTPRTATEQLLISNAVDQALDKVDFQPSRGRTVYLEEKYVDCVDKNYVIASLRHRLLAAGASLVPAADGAEVVVEARSGAVGTASAESFLGTPEIVLPGMLTIPEVRLMTRTRQEGAAKIGLVAYETATKRVLGPGGQSLATADNNLWYAAGIGLRRQRRHAGHAPAAADETAGFGRRGRRTGRAEGRPRLRRTRQGTGRQSADAGDDAHAAPHRRRHGQSIPRDVLKDGPGPVVARCGIRDRGKLRDNLAHHFTFSESRIDLCR